jgi:hypothetical protein
MITATVSSEVKATQIVEEVIENIVRPPLWWFKNANESEG